ncbi:MAG: YecA family protein [Acetobacteraceae bacterium]|nr:YecA family protein [Acetobacteraceae bacterium]
MIPDDPVDLEPLGDYLDSARAPEACMDLSELDGFLAGLAVGPDPVLPEEWLPMVWDDEDPEFADEAEADLILGTMFARYNEISDGLAGSDSAYDPVYWQDATGRTVVEDWTAGFMRAVGLRRDAWEGVLENAEGARLFIPIVAVASLASPEDIDPEDIGVSPPDMEELINHADTVLPACVVGLHAFWRERSSVPRPRLTVPVPRSRSLH